MATHDSVAHNWAHQTGRAQRGHNMFYDGPTIFSYGRHFPIASIVSPNVVLFTLRDFSSSTSVHKYRAERAVSHMRVYYVDNVDARSKDAHRLNLRGYFARVDKLLAQSSRRRDKGYAVNDIDQADGLCREARDYARQFKLGRVRLPNIDNIGPRLAELRVAHREEIAARAERTRIENIRIEKEDVPRWLAGEPIRLPWSLGRALLRVRKGDSRARYGVGFVEARGDYVETSQGVTFPVSDAIAAWPRVVELVKLARASSERVRPVEPIKLGGFRVDSVSRVDVRAGCHIVKWVDVIRVARALGLSG